MPLRRLILTFQEFAANESAGGRLLFGCAVAALLWSNSPWSRGYDTLFSHRAHFWINDVFMSLFFLLVGLEIKRELLMGELASPKQAALPVLAALGGVIVPALLYAAFNGSGPGAPGWGIPMATDIAFVIGAMALLGSRVPLGLKIFLTALAIADDIAAVVVIAIFYTRSLDVTALLIATSVLAMLIAACAMSVRHIPVFAALGLILWFAVLQSGVHATIAGVVLAMTIPLALLPRMERALHPWVSFGIMPLFALANAGVAFAGAFRESQPVSLGVLCGLLFGKPIGILLASWLAVSLRMAVLPAGVTWHHIHGAGWLGGIGFTMSLFIAGLAFGGGPMLTAAKAGILVGSAMAGVIGLLLLRRADVRTAA
ncbi:MAG: Na+/H+ antiporter NhaA [Candidatus Solibacter usitatus]|nr:Na+/H+ antiporter NhaA [Candidatus Solibacter usitatus]